MAEEKRKTVKVICSIPNGLELRLFKKGHDDGSGHTPMVVDASKPRVFLAGPSAAASGTGDTMMSTAAPVHNEVDAEYFEAWLEQNKMSPMVAGGLIAKADEERKEREPE